jgi:hypothetical protein
MIAIPNLDTVDFEALVEEGRGLIPRYAPAWTDHNLHDPGITLLDLIAWFVDQQIYRVGFVSDAHYAAIAALLGVVPQAAKPAIGLIWPNAGALTSSQDLANGTRAHPNEQPELAFVVTKDLRLRATNINSIEAHIGQTVRSVKPDDDGRILLDAQTEAIDLVCEELLDGGAPIALGLAYPGPLPDLGERPPAEVSFRGGGGIWRRLEAEWCAAPDRTNGVLVIPVPTVAEPIKAIRLDLGTGLPRRLVPVRVALNVVPVTQVEILNALKIGEGTGWPDLELTLGVEQGSVPTDEIELTSGPRDNPLEWQRKGDLAGSGPSDAHFLFDPVRGTIRFGNGVNGRAMPAGHEVSCGSLRVTRGAQGNLAAGASWTVGGISVVGKAGFGINRAAVSGGADAWTRDELLAELHRRARKRTAMLTDADMIGAATKLAGYGIERAEVLARFLPTLHAHDVPGARTLLLRPSGNVEATDAWVDAIEGALAHRRMLGERLTVAAVEEVAINVEAELLVAAGSDQDQIRRDAIDRLSERLSIGKRRADQDIEPWPAGRPVTVAELETLLAAVNGVIAVTDMQLGRTGKTLERTSLPLSRLEVATVEVPVVRFRVER